MSTNPIQTSTEVLEFIFLSSISGCSVTVGSSETDSVDSGSSGIGGSGLGTSISLSKSEEWTSIA